MCMAVWNISCERDALARRMVDVKSEISRVLHVKCRAFLTLKDDFLVSV